MLRGEKGVTLLELLVAVVITVLLAGSVYAVFKQGMDSWMIGEARTQRYQNARVGLDRMAKEMRSAISLSRRHDGTTNSESFAGTANTVDFLTTSNPPPWNQDYTTTPDSIYYDVCEIGYRVSGTTLYRRKAEKNKPDVDVDDTTDGSDMSWASHVTGLSFEYYDGSSWQTSWTASNTLPKQVKITLTVQADVAPAGRSKVAEDISTRVYIPLGN